MFFTGPDMLWMMANMQVVTAVVTNPMEILVWYVKINVWGKIGRELVTVQNYVIKVNTCIII